MSALLPPPGARFSALGTLFCGTMLGAAAFAAVIGVIVSAGSAVLVLVVKGQYEPRPVSKTKVRPLPLYPPLKGSL